MPPHWTSALLAAIAVLTISSSSTAVEARSQPVTVWEEDETCSHENEEESTTIDSDDLELVDTTNTVDTMHWGRGWGRGWGGWGRGWGGYGYGYPYYGGYGYGYPYYGGYGGYGYGTCSEEETATADYE